jgi:hypothetical protein
VISQFREVGTIDVPGGLIHHWLGTVFVPDANVRSICCRNYEHRAEICRPAIARSLSAMGANLFDIARTGRPSVPFATGRKTDSATRQALHRTPFARWPVR